jgi:hypothetical protein
VLLTRRSHSIPKTQIRQGADCPDRRSHRRVGTCHNALLRGVKPQARHDGMLQPLRTCTSGEVSKDPRQWAPRLPGLHARLTYRSYADVPTKIGRALSGRTRTYSRQTQRSAIPSRSPSFGAVQSPDLSRGKQAHWRARPSILRAQSRSKRGQRQTGWSCASEFSRAISSAAPCGSSSRLMRSGMSDPGFERCDGHHEVVDLKLRKKRSGLNSFH